MRAESTVERRTPLPVSPGELWDWHSRPGALDRLTPPWLRLRRLGPPAELAEGSRQRLRIRLGVLRATWTAEHREVEPGAGFTDVQVAGPFASWRHEHRFEPAVGGSALVDRIRFALPAGAGVAEGWVTRQLERILAYRHAVTAADLAMYAGAPPRALRVAVTGSTGFIGSLLLPMLTTAGHQVTRIVRGSPRGGELSWDPRGRGIDPARLEGVDAVIHLAGENIGVRWTADRKRRIMDSRRTGTRLLAGAIAGARNGPRILLSASAVGYYGNRGEEELTEESRRGTGFLADVVEAWEGATRVASDAGVRVALMRTGLPLSPRGGMLGRMMLPFRLGLGGRLGSGRQWASWISADDLAGAFHHVLARDGLHGPVNVVGPSPVRNAELTRELGRLLRRPAMLPVPAFALRALFADMADEAILASARVTPGVLLHTGYHFRHGSVTAALRHVLGLPA